MTAVILSVVPSDWLMINGGLWTIVIIVISNEIHEGLSCRIIKKILNYTRITIDISNEIHKYYLCRIIKKYKITHVLQ